MAQVRAEVQGANAKELLDNLTEKCYSKCIPKPGTTMSSSEEVGPALARRVECLTFVCRHVLQDAWTCISKRVRSFLSA
jgi:import inner membrane translocase subunit TIM13